MTRPVVKADVDRGTITVGVLELTRLEAVGLAGELTHALIATWPPEDPNWQLDRRRETAEGRSRSRSQTSG